MHRIVTASIAVVAFCFALSIMPAWSQEPPPAPQPPAAASDAEEEVSDGEWRYNPAGKRDPFKDLILARPRKKDVSKLPPIQQFELKQIKISGIIMDESTGARAMIKAGNRSFMVKKGDIIGRNDGVVTEVNLDGIRVEETFVDFMKRETTKETFIKSHKKSN